MIDQESIDTLWVLASAILVLLMQPGFLCLESGLTRAKNATNVAIKNLTDVSISFLLFWACGFGLMYGTSVWGLFGSSYWALNIQTLDSSTAVFFVFQAAFCGAATTIVSGAVAERMRFKSYVVAAAMVSGFLYPVFGHWCWGGRLMGDPGWLVSVGFTDFAGCSVVHCLGGWVALAAVLVVGARAGRFPKDKPPARIYGQSQTLAVAGVLLLWIGCIGFNGGSEFGLTEATPAIITNTMLSGASGLACGLLIGFWMYSRPMAELIINGTLAGLVAITASCDCVSSLQACMIGAVSVVVMFAGSALLERWKIDDAVGAIPVHAFAGTWGVIAAGVFGDVPAGVNGRMSFVAIQAFGACVCFAWAFGVGFLILKSVNFLSPLRVSAEDEATGLNTSEHGARSDLLELTSVMQQQAQSGDLSRRCPVEPFTEVGQIAELYNGVLESLENTQSEQRRLSLQLREANVDLKIESGGRARVNEQLKALSEDLERRVTRRTEQLADTVEKLEISNTELRQFAYVVSHDLQSPLRHISNFAQFLREDFPEGLSETGDDYINRIISSVQRMKDLIHDLLAYSKVDFREAECSNVSLSLAAVDAVEMLDDSIRELKAVVTIGELPTVQCNRRQLTQLFQNLIENGMKYRSSDPPKIEISSRTRDEQTVVTVADNGIGIAPEFHDVVFDIFRRLHLRDEYTGTGIGLAICRRICNRNGGEIWVEPNHPQGTVFCFSLPHVVTSLQGASTEQHSA